MSDTYNKVLQSILCKVAEVDEDVHEKEIEKIDEIYLKLTGNHMTKFKIFEKILESDGSKTVDDFLKKNINSLEMTQKINIVHAAEEVMTADGIHHVEEKEFLAKLKNIVFTFK